MSFAAGSGILLTALFLALAPSGSAMAAPGDLLTTNRTNVNVRATPSTAAPIVARINPGETIIEQDRQHDWYQVRLPNRDGSGWIYGPLLQEVVDLPPAPANQVVPVDQDTSTEPAVAADQPRAALDAASSRSTGTAQFPRVAAFDDRLIGNPARGETVFYKCGACHTTVPGVHAQGPSLVGVFGRPPALSPGFRYSGAMQSFARNGAVWDEATLDRFIQRPAHVVEGTTMPFSGVRDAQDRRDLIAYLKRL